MAIWWPWKIYVLVSMLDFLGTKFIILIWTLKFWFFVDSDVWKVIIFDFFDSLHLEKWFFDSLFCVFLILYSDLISTLSKREVWFWFTQLLISLVVANVAFHETCPQKQSLHFKLVTKSNGKSKKPCFGATSRKAIFLIHQMERRNFSSVNNICKGKKTVSFGWKRISTVRWKKDINSGVKKKRYQRWGEKTY